MQRLVVLDIAGLFFGPALFMSLLMICHVPEDVAGSLALLLFLVWGSWLGARMRRRS